MAWHTCVCNERLCWLKVLFASSRTLKEVAYRIFSQTAASNIWERVTSRLSEHASGPVAGRKLLHEKTLKYALDPR